MNRDILEKPFDSEQIKQREGSFGKTLDYVEGHTVIKRLNDAFDGDWSFSIIKHEIIKETDEVIVLGELGAGAIKKTQFGSSRLSKCLKSMTSPTNLPQFTWVTDLSLIVRCLNLFIDNHDIGGLVQVETPKRNLRSSKILYHDHIFFDLHFI
ncbi:Rad52/Rad22 family DNA repair protein [Thermodesulfobacteriota bacterium]